MLAILIAIIVLLLAGATFFLLSRRKTIVKLTNDEYNLLMNQKFDRFMMKTFMARGDINSTYEALDADRNKVVALRVLHKSLSYNDNMVQQFFFKGEMLKYLADRFPGNHFIQSVAFGTARVFDEQRPYIVSDYIWGVSLSELLNRFGVLSPRDTVTVITQVAESVKMAHSQRIWMRELSPANIIVTVNDAGKPLAIVANIGIPFKSLPSESSAELRKGYYSPEDRRGQDVNEQSDVYALASLTFRMLEGYDVSARKEGQPWTGTSALLESALIDSTLSRTPSVDGFMRLLTSIQTAPPTVKDLQWGVEIIRIIKGHGKIKVKRSGSETLSQTTTRRSYAPVVPRETKERVVGGFMSGVAAAFVMWIGKKVESIFSSPKNAIRAGIIAIVALALALWYFVFAPPKTTVTVITEPSGAAVVVNGVTVGESTPVKDHTVDSGKVILRIQKVGFFTVDTTVSASRGQHQEVSVMLHPAANLSISINPPDALVVLDKDTLAARQMGNLETSIGKHQIIVVKAGLQGVARELDLKQGTNPPLTFTLAKGAPRLSVTSDPPGAMVYVNESLSGSTPYQNSDIQPGTYRVRVAMDGYEEYAEAVSIRTDREDNIDVKLSPAVAFVLTTDPPGGEVIVDGKDEGPTPLTAAKIKVGQRSLKIKKLGYQDYDTTLMVVEKQNLTLTATLVPLRAPARFIIKPFGTIYVDDKPLAADQSTYSGDLPAGTHVIKVVHPSYGTWQKSETIVPRKAIDFSIDFNVFVTISVISVDESGKTLPGASISVDGNKTDQYTPGQITRRTGLHIIDIQRDGYASVGGAMSVNLEPGQKGPVKFTMKKVK